MRITVDGEMSPRQAEGHQQPRVTLNNGRFKSTNEGDVLRLSLIKLHPPSKYHPSQSHTAGDLQNACALSAAAWPD